jgi:hypothetical protein
LDERRGPASRAAQGQLDFGPRTSRHEEGTFYAVVNNYRNDDFANYLFKSADYGQTWTSITGNLPANRVLRIVREDIKNPKLLFLGAELGLFFTLDGGRHWIELKNNMPTMAFNDLLIHPRDNDLVLGTHSRGIWILDNIACLRELTPDVLASDFSLFTIEEAEMIRLGSDRGAVGDMVFRGENPPAGAVIDYYVRQVPEEGRLALSIYDPSGTKIADLKPAREAGINRVVWNLRYPDLPSRDRPGSTGRRSRSLQGPLVQPGIYTARLSLDGKSMEKTFEVKEDPRLRVSSEERGAWTKTLFDIADLHKSVLAGSQTVTSILTQMAELEREKRDIAKGIKSEVEELNRMFTELLSRVGGLYGQVMGWTGRPTEDQSSRMKYYTDMAKTLEKRRQSLVSTGLPKLNSRLPPDKRIKFLYPLFK